MTNTLPTSSDTWQFPVGSEQTPQTPEVLLGGDLLQPDDPEGLHDKWAHDRYIASLQREDSRIHKETAAALADVHDAIAQSPEAKAANATALSAEQHQRAIHQAGIYAPRIVGLRDDAVKNLALQELRD